MFWQWKLSEPQKLSLIQFIKFGIVGVGNTVIAYIVYTVSLILFQKIQMLQTIDYLMAQMAAFVLSVLWSFYWNNKKVFVCQENQKRSVWKALIRTYVVYAVSGLLISGALLVFWVQFCHISKLIAPVINLLITVPLNFWLNKKWAFAIE